MSLQGDGYRRIRWYTTKSAREHTLGIRELHGELNYFRDVRDLRDFLSGYFDSSNRCNSKIGSSVSPIGRTESGGKILKVRWIFPGAGKSGGWRLCFVAYCEQRKVVLTYASLRREVDEDKLVGSASDAEGY